jgi:hypothetical protein
MKNEKQMTMSLPELGTLAATRALAGAGLGLLVADQLKLENRRPVGWTLFGLGALSTIPILIEVLSHQRKAAGEIQ